MTGGGGDSGSTGRGRSRASLTDAGQELNLIPYLDIMVNLVIFMLLNMTGFLSFTILNASIPQLSASPQKVINKTPKKELLLMVRVEDKAFLVDPSVQGGKSLPKKRINKNADGSYDFESLNTMAKGVKTQFKDEVRVLIISKSTVIYDDIIKTMDALRDKEEPGDQELFPEVTLSIL